MYVPEGGLLLGADGAWLGGQNTCFLPSCSPDSRPDLAPAKWMSAPGRSLSFLSKQLLFGPGAGQESWAYLTGAEGSWGSTSFSPSCVTRASVRRRGDAAANGRGVHPARCLYPVWSRVCRAAGPADSEGGGAQRGAAAQQLVGSADTR